MTARSATPHTWSVASQAEIDAALGPFVERFIRKENRERATNLFMPMRKRARPQDLFDHVDPSTSIELDGSPAATAAIASVEAAADGVYLHNTGAAFLATFDQVRREVIREDVSMFIARSGKFALFIDDVGDPILIVLRGI